MNPELKKTIRVLGFISSTGVTMALSVVIGAFVGYHLDNWLGTKPWLFFLFLLFGIVAAFRNLYILYKKAKKL